MSKELEALTRMYVNCNDYMFNGFNSLNDQKTIKTALERNEKALSIIKVKKVDCNFDIFCSLNYKNYYKKAIECNYAFENILTEEEFKFLKEMLEDEK